jgi:hypothetical protein
MMRFCGSRLLGMWAAILVIPLFAQAQDAVPPQVAVVIVAQSWRASPGRGSGGRRRPRRG